MLRSEWRIDLIFVMFFRGIYSKACSGFCVFAFSPFQYDDFESCDETVGTLSSTDLEPTINHSSLVILPLPIGQDSISVEITKSFGNRIDQLHLLDIGKLACSLTVLGVLSTVDGRNPAVDQFSQGKLMDNRW